jgi:tetratricopeptide (TPR) repeat protein
MTCFVIMGYGLKTDHATGRTFNLDKVYNTIIKPVFKELGIHCIRANEIKHSGSIEYHMYDSILKADIVVADLSTLNPNALYELGVRHALRPHTTIIMGESGLSDPFDLNHIVMYRYVFHDTEVIDIEEVERFRGVLKELVKSLIEADNKVPDSPIYTFLPNLEPPTYPLVFSKDEIEQITEEEKDLDKLEFLISKAEEAKSEDRFIDAKALYSTALALDPNNTFLKQRLALSTYQSQIPSKEEALNKAELILSDLEPLETTDPETLGLMGAICKRRYELSLDSIDLDRSLMFYEKGFHVRNNYYYGINVAYLLVVRASKSENLLYVIADYIRAKKIWQHIILMCQKIIDHPEFELRDDKMWVWQTIGQAYLGLNDEDRLEECIPFINLYSEGAFDLRTYKEQNTKLVEALFICQVRLDKAGLLQKTID